MNTEVQFNVNVVLNIRTMTHIGKVNGKSHLHIYSLPTLPHSLSFLPFSSFFTVLCGFVIEIEVPVLPDEIVIC